MYRFLLFIILLGNTLNFLGNPYLNENYQQPFVPAVNLGSDTTVCGSVVLDAGNEGATYLWNTTETTQTIQVSSSGTYWVDVTDSDSTVRDSINITVLNPPENPTILDLNACGISDVLLSADHEEGELLWYDAFDSDIPIGISDSFSIEVSSSTNIYSEASFLEEGISAGHPNISSGNYFAIGNERGIIFNVIQPFRFDSVSIYVNGPLMANMIIRNPEGIEILSKSLNLTEVGENVIGINTFFNPGNGYQITLASLSGSGRLYVRINNQFPFGNSFIDFISGTPILEHYNYFFDWQISVPGSCNSERDSATIAFFEQPEVDLGVDTLYCGVPTLELDAGNPGANYLWSTGETTQTISISSSGNYQVDVSFTEECKGSGEVFLDLIDRPIDPMLSDTSFCEPTFATLAVENASTLIYWNKIVKNDTIPASLNQEFTAQFDTFTNIITEGVTFISGGSAGIAAELLTNFFAIGDQRGLFFDVLEPIILDSLSLDVNGEQVGTIQIINPEGVLIFEKDVELDIIGENRIGLNVPLIPGTDYQIALANLGLSGRLQVNTLADYPIESNEIVITRGFPIEDHYNYFYDWGLSLRTNCSSEPVVVGVDIEIPINLADSVYSCTSVQVNPQIESGDFLWSTGETSAVITADSTGLYIVNILNDNGCSVRDSIFVEIPTDVGLPEDGILCDTLLTTNYGSDADFVWSTGDTTDFISVTIPGTYSVNVIEPRGCELNDQVEVAGFDSPPDITLGSDFISCDSAEIGIDDENLSYLWSTGEETNFINVSASGLYIVQATNVNGCTGSDSISVSIQPPVNASFFIPDTVISGSLTITFNNLSSFGSYDWDFGDGNTGNAIVPTHSYVDTGFYCVSLVVSDIQGICSTDSVTNCFQLLRFLTDIDDLLTDDEFQLFPNPASTEINIKWNFDSNQPMDVKLYTIQGKLTREYRFTQLGSSGEKVLSLEGISPGLYMLHVITASGEAINKIVIK